MIDMNNILVATDLTLNALDRAIQLADVTQAKLHVFHQALDLSLPGKHSEEESLSEKTLDKIRDFIEQNKRCANIDYEIHIKSKGRTYELIDKCARDVRADLVIMGLTNKYKNTPSFVSTTSERVIQTGNYPVLMVSHKVTGLYQNILFYLNMNDLSPRAFKLAFRFNPKGGFVFLPAFNVLPTVNGGFWGKRRAKRYFNKRERFINEARQTLEKYEGNPQNIEYKDIQDVGANLLLAEAQKNEAGLVCIDLHTYTASLHLKVKGFAGKLLQHPPSDVLVVKRI